MAEGKVLSDCYQASFVIWHGMLGYKEISCPENECSRDGMPVEQVERIKLSQVKRVQKRPKKTWMEVIRQDIEAKGLNEGILLDRNEWRMLIHVPDPA